MSKTSITNWFLDIHVGNHFDHTQIGFWIFTLATILTTHYADNPSYIARYLT